MNVLGVYVYTIYNYPFIYQVLSIVSERMNFIIQRATGWAVTVNRVHPVTEDVRQLFVFFVYLTVTSTGYFY